MWHGHGCIANSEALRRSGIDGHTENPTGSVIEHFDDGTPSGVLQEAGALQLVFAGMPSFTPEEIADKLEKGQRFMNSLGYTGYTECTVGTANNGREGGASGENCLKAYQILLREKRMTARTAVGFYSGRGGVQSPEWLKEDLEEKKVPVTEDGDWLSFHMMKFFCDGVEVAHTAWLKEDYADAPGNHGIIVSSQPGLIAASYEKGCELLGEEKGLGLMPLKTLTDAGVLLCGGSDSIAGDYHDWREALHHAVTKKSAVTGKVYHPEERLTLFEALRMYTCNGAYQEFAEEKRGMLEAGKFADFIVLDRDIFLLDPEEYTDVRVLRTVVDGRTVWEA